MGVEGQDVEEMLNELAARAARAYVQLDELATRTRRYIHEAIKGIVRTFAPDEHAHAQLLKFGETCTKLLSRAHAQARERLEKVVDSLERGDVSVVRRGKTLRVVPRGRAWFVAAHYKDCWLFRLPIRGVSGRTSFPDLLRLPSEKLLMLQAGWRASDECNNSGRPAMGTTQPWQILAWAATRYGLLRIWIDSVYLNKRGSTLGWTVRAESWEQRWSEKERARALAEQHPLGFLTLYLGDGCKHPDTLKIAVGNDEEIKPRRLVPEIIAAAYECGYGRLLDAIQCEKWQALKKLAPKQNPVYASFNSRVFWLCYSETSIHLQARTVLKSEEEARELAQELAAQGVHARINRWGEYWVVGLCGREIAKLAERYKEWRRALRELAEKKNIRARGPVTRKLLKLVARASLPRSSRASFDSHVFRLCYTKYKLLARAHAKSEEEARKCVQELIKRGIRARVQRVGEYWAVELSASEIAKLAEQSEEWRQALRELAERGLRAKGPVTYKLLKLAGVPASYPFRSLPVNLNNFQFRLYPSLRARASFKSREDAEKCLQELVAQGISAHTYRKLGDKYWAVELCNREVLKLAERYEEWRRALRELTEKNNIQPRGPVTRRILELAENPPLPPQNL